MLLSASERQASETVPGVVEYDVLLDRVAVDAQVVGGEGRVGIADRQPAQDRVLVRDVELFADDLGVAGDRHLHAGAESARGQREQEGLQEHADAEAVDVVQVAVHADDAGQRCAEELPVAQHGDPAALGIVAGDAHGAIDLLAEFAAQVREQLGQFGYPRRLAAGLVEQGGDEAIPGGARDEPQVPGLDVGVRRGADREFRASSTISRGTGLSGRNMRVECRSLMACSRSYMDAPPCRRCFGMSRAYATIGAANCEQGR